MEDLKSALNKLENATSVAEGVQLPTEEDHYYYRNFNQFNQRVDGFLGRIQALLTGIPGNAPAQQGTFKDVDDAREWVTAALDDAVERIEGSLTDAQQATASKDQQAANDGRPSLAIGARPVPGHPAPKKEQAGRGYVSYMRSTLREKPQTSFADGVDNTNAPWVPRLDALKDVIDVKAARSEAELAAAKGLPRPHPLRASIDALQYPDWQLQAPTERLAELRSFDDTPFSLIDTLPALQQAAARLASEREIAVDLEAHNYRSFQGFCCLMQLSTRTEDIVIDVLTLREHIGPALAPIFANPAVVKVLHGSDGDVVWLQRDFGIFLCNLFDTGQAVRVLDYPGHGLAYLLEKACGFKADKRWQLADWRLRPLDPEAVHYARADTHFLLHCYDLLRAELANKPVSQVPEHLIVELPPHGPQDALGITLERSRRLSLFQYERELTKEDSFLAHYHKGCGKEGVLSDKQLSVFAAMHAWRDRVAREEDESLGYILSRRLLWEIAKARPLTAYELSRAVGKSAPVVQRRAKEVLQALQPAHSKEEIARVAAMRREWIEKAGESLSQDVQMGQLMDLKVAAAAAAAVTPSQGFGGMETGAPKTQKQSDGNARVIQHNVLAVGGSTQDDVCEAVAAEDDVSCAEAHQKKPIDVPQGPRVLKPKTVKPLVVKASSFSAGAAHIDNAEAINDRQSSSLLSNDATVHAKQKFILLPLAETPSSFGSLFSNAPQTANAALVSDAAEVVKRVHASFALPLFSAAQAVHVIDGDAGKQKRQDAEFAPSEPLGEEVPLANGAQRDQRAEVRAAMAQLAAEEEREEDIAAGGGAVPTKQATESPSMDNEAEQHQRVVEAGDASAFGEDGPEDFLPLALSERFSLKKNRRQRQKPHLQSKRKQPRKGADADPDAVDVAVKRQKKDEQRAAALEQEQRVKQSLEAAGLEGEEEDADQHEQHDNYNGGKADGGKPPAADVDYQGAAAKYDLGILNPHGKRRGRGGRHAGNGHAGRGGSGRGRGRGRGGRGGKSQKADEGGQRRFNPYGVDLTGIKGGKRSAVHVRSGDKSMSFK